MRSFTSASPLQEQRESMRIAIFVRLFPCISETFILRQICGLLDMGHEVDIYAEERPQDGEPVQPEVAEYGLLSRTTYIDGPPEALYWEMPAWPPAGKTWIPGSTHHIPNVLRLLKALPVVVRCLAQAPRTTLRVLNPRLYGYQARSLSALYRVFALLSRRGHKARIDKGPYDLLHAHFGPVGNSFRFARELFRAPTVVSFHGYDLGAWPRKRGGAVYRSLFGEIDIVTVNSGYTRTRLLKLGCPAHKLRKLPMGLDLTDFSFRARTRSDGEPLRLLTVGRLVEKKGIEYAIRAISQVREKHPRVIYSIVGDGPLRLSLQELIKDLELEQNVALCGPLDTLGVRKMMGEAHIFLLPSVTAVNGDVEGQGLALQEAQACGLPVIATDHNGFSEGIVPGESGLLVPERDVPVLAHALNQLIEHPERWPQMGLSGRQHVETHFNVRTLNLELVRIYEEAVAKYSAPRRR
jgi:colanic acid/amylovoran biosynthesis glycosyltransferase